MLSSCKLQTQMSEHDKKEQRWNIEIDLLKFYGSYTHITIGMQVGVNCFLFDYEIEYQKNHYSIHTFSAGEADQEILVLLHGFGISNVHYCRVYKELIKKFRVFSIDLPGMGYSSKQNIKMDTQEEAIEFFMGTISKFIQEILPGQKVILGGHSFGGYIATHLVIKFPELFSQLYLLSPAGLTHYNDNQIKELQDTSQFSFWDRMYHNYAQNKWSEQVTLNTLKNRWYGNLCINWYIKKRLQLTGKEYDVWHAYMHVMLSLPNGSEKALFILLNYPNVFAKQNFSIEYLLTDNYQKIKDIPIFIYFGETDWMDQKGAKNLENNPQFKNIKITIIPNTSHQLNFYNPNGFLEQIFHDSKNPKFNDNKTIFQENQISLT